MNPKEPFIRWAPEEIKARNGCVMNTRYIAETHYDAIAAALKVVQDTSIAHAGKQNARIRALEAALRDARSDLCDISVQSSVHASNRMCMVLVAKIGEALSETQSETPVCCAGAPDHYSNCPNFEPNRTAETSCDSDDAPENLEGFDKNGAVFKIGGKVVSREEGLAAFKAHMETK